MAGYRLSERHMPNHEDGRVYDPNSVDLGKVGSVFIIFGVLGLITAWIFSMETEQLFEKRFVPRGAELEGGIETEFGPINVRKRMVTYNISIDANLPLQSWSFIEGTVLDSRKQYLFAFGKELWHERGSDWHESVDEIDMKVTFPSPGTYYIRLKTESNQEPKEVKIKVTKMRGSSLLHFWFGVICLITGIVLNEIRNRTVVNFLERMNEKYGE